MWRVRWIALIGGNLRDRIFECTEVTARWNGRPASQGSVIPAKAEICRLK